MFSYFIIFMCIEMPFNGYSNIEFLKYLYFKVNYKDVNTLSLQSLYY